jgi:hypothetical protein
MKLWVNWEDRCLMWNEIDEDVIMDMVWDIYYKENPDFEPISDNIIQDFIDAMGADRFEEIKQMAIEKIEDRFEYFEI